MSKLTVKQSRFVDEYLIDFNATQAAIRSGYSKKTAQEQSSRLLSKVIISTAIKERQEKTSERLEITRDEILMDLKRIKDEHKAKGEWPPHALKAIEILNKMLGFNEPDQSEVTHKGINITIIKPKKD